MEFASVRARINGAAASGAFILVLELLSQDGRIMAQSRIDQEFAVGDTVAATWAPFLKRTAAATPSGSFTAQYMWMRNDNGVQSIVSSTNWTRCDFSAGTNGISDSSRFEVGSPNADYIEVIQAGLYLVRGVVAWDAGGNFNNGIMLFFDHHDWGSALSFPTQTAEVNFGAGPTVMQVVRLPSGTSSVSLYVYQASGAAIVLNDMYMDVHYIGDYQGQPADPSPF